MDLSGEWRFRLDPDEVGIDAGWYGAPLEQPGKIHVPGCWEAQGYGEATAEAKHSFVGWGWYQRRFVPPGRWQGRRVFLHIGGVHRTASVFLNGLAIGHHVGYVTAARFEVTDALRFGGQNVLTIRVDSEQHPESDGLAGCFDTYDFIKWGGIFRDVWLEVVGSAWLDNLFARSEDGASRARITADVQGAGVEAPGLHVRCRLEPTGGTVSRPDAASGKSMSAAMTSTSTADGSSCAAMETTAASL
jgi:beta-galactosidase/beta-glucuronidase